MAYSFERRGFLRSLAALPLIGGGITLIGTPTKAAVPVTTDLLETYRQWLLAEWLRVSYELRPPASTEQTFFRRDIEDPAARFHLTPEGDWNAVSPPSSRAAVVLSAVGCEWRSNKGGRS